MKKFLSVMAVFIIFTAVLFAGCGNMSMGLGNYNYRYIHVEGIGCFKIDKWHDDSEGVEVHTTEYGNMFFAESTKYILVEGTDTECSMCKYNHDNKTDGIAINR